MLQVQDDLHLKHAFFCLLSQDGNDRKVSADFIKKSRKKYPISKKGVNLHIVLDTIHSKFHFLKLIIL
jgi:hypothetical protein